MALGDWLAHDDVIVDRKVKKISFYATKVVEYFILKNDFYQFLKSALSFFRKGSLANFGKNIINICLHPFRLLPNVTIVAMNVPLVRFR